MTIGDIGNTIQTLEFDTSHGEWPFIKKVENGLYAVGYTGPGDDGFTKSFNITDAGVISEPASNLLEHYTANAAYTKSCLRPVNNIVHAFQIIGSDLRLECIRVASNGTLDQHANHGLIVDDNNIRIFNVQYQRGSIVSMAYDYGDGTPYVATVTVSSDGQVTDPRTDRLQLNVLLSDHVSCIRVSDSILMVVWLQANSDLRGRTCSIASDGTISNTAQAVAQLCALWTNFPHLIHMHDDWYICAFQSSGNALELCAFQVNSAGIISVPANQTHQVDADNGWYPHLFKLSNTMVGIFSVDASEESYLNTVNFTAGDPVVWSNFADKHIGSNCEFPWSALMVNHNTAVLAYTGLNTDGYLETYEIEAEPPEGAQHEMIMGIGP